MSHCYLPKNPEKSHDKVCGQHAKYNYVSHWLELMSHRFIFAMLDIGEQPCWLAVTFSIFFLHCIRQVSPEQCCATDQNSIYEQIRVWNDTSIVISGTHACMHAVHVALT